MMRQSLAEFCHEYNMEYLLQEWNTEQNGGLRPDSISHGSNKKIWWTCREGHTWQATPGSRTRVRTGCPYCNHKKVCAGNDLRSTHPSLADEWHPTKNGSMKPENFSAGSHQYIWWQCKEGHEWRATVKSRVEGNGCPYCANRIILKGRNDLAATHPDIAAEWHPTKNNGLQPDEVFAGSTRRVWWQCGKHHEWRASIESRTRGNGCPVCNNRMVVTGENDLATAAPDLVKEWSFEKNGNLKPENVSAYSNRRVWWRCALGHEWQTTVAARMTKASGCPYCTNRKVLAGFNDLATTHPRIAAEWHPTLNRALTPEQVTRGSTKKVWWQCSDGHSWQAYIHARTGQETGCPECAGKKKLVKRNYYARIEAEKHLESGRMAAQGENFP